MRPARLLLSLSPVLLAGCIHGGNIKGDFVCKAPDGTCAPMSNIDASALASLGTSPATPTALPGAAAADPLFRPVPLPPGAVPQRAGERVLKVVFPAHVDASGVYRDEATAYAAVERPSWTGPSAPVRTVAVPASLDELVAAASPAAPAATQPAVTSSASLTGVPISPATAYTYPGQSAAPQQPRPAASLASPAPLSIREVFAAASAPPLEPEPLVAASAPDDAAGVQVPTRHRVKCKGRWYWRPGPPRSRTLARPVGASMTYTAALNRQQIEAVSAPTPPSASAVFSPPPSDPAPNGSAAEIAAGPLQGSDAGQLENPQ